MALIKSSDNVRSLVTATFLRDDWLAPSHSPFKNKTPSVVALTVGVHRKLIRFICGVRVAMDVPPPPPPPPTIIVRTVFVNAKQHLKKKKKKKRVY